MTGATWFDEIRSRDAFADFAAVRDKQVGRLVSETSRVLTADPEIAPLLESSTQIADRGVGVPDSFKEVLFKKFVSVEAARGGPRLGFGLGLYLVNLVATAHGGHAVIRDREGGGASFGFFIPRQPTLSAS
jgi:signal transduction histidine kinase